MFGCVGDFVVNCVSICNWLTNEMDIIDQLVRIGRYHSRGLNSFAFSYVEVMRTNIFKNMVCTGECNLLVYSCLCIVRGSNSITS